jgi:hypothetical protein
MENRIMKPLKFFKRAWRGIKKRGEYDQSALHACMEMSQ